jgi:hypothetical protein
MSSKKHVECQEGESFLSNMTVEDFRDMMLLTKRLGNIAYDSNGNVIDKAFRLFPAFAKDYEIAYNNSHLRGKIKNENSSESSLSLVA